MLYFSLFSSPSNEDSSCNESCPSSEGAIEPALPGLINRDEDGIIPRFKIQYCFQGIYSLLAAKLVHSYLVLFLLGFKT